MITTLLARMYCILALTNFILWLFSSWVRALELTVKEWNVSVGQPFNITWDKAKPPIGIDLDTRNGHLVSVIYYNSELESSFLWTPEYSLATEKYFLFLRDGTGYGTLSPIFNIIGYPDITQPATTTTTQPTSPASSPTKSPSNLPTNSSEVSSLGGLSTGAKAGIGVGAGIGGLVLVTAAGLLLYRCGKAVGQRSHVRSNEFKSEMSGEPKLLVELGSTIVAEMPPRVSLAIEEEPSELEAPTRYRPRSER
ncbi:hypothetical protein GGR57DRAFT_515580 [Xylariaceae sp. FL1272]|nr:hypothetical protein GGR57DRAFT_515580 [Xylariaceae sp. FL1272]